MEKLNKVKPRILPGFMELLPREQIEFNRIKEIIEKHYRLAGFVPQDTPILELSEVLLAKAGGETEKQIYRFTKGDNDLSLRFDLTVPLARYVAEHYGELSFPLKRYQIGKVYRGERPQKGRYREFYQADIDIIGEEKLDIINDAEMPSIIYGIFKELDFGPFTIRLNNRKVLNGFFESLNLTEKIADILRVIDKLDKIGIDFVKEDLVSQGVSSDQIERIMNLILIKGTQDEMIQKLKDLNIDNEKFNQGVEELEKVVTYIRAFGVPDDYFALDLTIARGLDYYTGTVYETVLNEHKEIGSVCSGGRYEDLAGYYTNKKLPGVGISIGLTRLFSQLVEHNLIEFSRNTTAEVLVIPMGVENEFPVRVVSQFKQSEISSLIVFEKTGIKSNLNYANKMKIPYVAIIGEDELNERKITLKNMETGAQDKITVEEAIEKIKQQM